ncbi:hypothetical protein UlMin_024185 [Ulmus minor]
MAEGFELFTIPRQTTIEPNTNTIPHPYMPNDTRFDFPSRRSAVDQNPTPLFQLFSDNPSHDVVSLRGNLSVPEIELRSSVPLGPFTGYASILRRSSFLKPAQQLLEEFCGSGRGDPARSLLDQVTATVKDPIETTNRVGYQFEKSKLMFMLEEVYKKYKLYCQQIQSVVASFETVAGLGDAAPYISSAIKAISNHFGCLKIAILGQLQFPAKTGNGFDAKEFKNSRLLTSKRGHSHSQNPVQNLTNLQHSVWKSQRGLPEPAVAVLRRWLFEHFLHPYPTDSEKLMLAQQTGLSRSQVSNWFINSRVRIWKPMVEEIHFLQTQQAPVLSETVPNRQTPRDILVTKRSRNEHQETCKEDQQMGEKHRIVATKDGGRGSGAFALNLRHYNRFESSSESFPKAFGHPFGSDASSFKELVFKGKKSAFH